MKRSGGEDRRPDTELLFDRFFGIGKILHYLRNYRKPVAIMILGSVIGSVYDVVIPVFQRYALNHFITLGTLEGMPLYIILYLAAILILL